MSPDGKTELVLTSVPNATVSASMAAAWTLPGSESGVPHVGG